MAALTFAAAAWADDVPAFPGAEGHGRYVTGGRGGTVIHVTNLDDSGRGSFRQAVSSSAKKIIVFDVAGVIVLKSDVNIGANTTIEGQTAPYPGITLRYYNVNPNGNNIIMRFLRIRRGQEKNVNDGADASTARHFTGILIDHCSFSWSIDEVASFYDNNNFTMQWCTIGEPLINAGHGKGAHGYGGIWGGKLASFHHNLLLHQANRSPRFNGARYNWTGYTGNLLYSQYKWENAVQAEHVDFRNCVVYNCGNGCYGGPGGGKVNMVGNYYKSGPGGTTSRLTKVSVGDSGNADKYPIYWDMTSRYYLEGNVINGNAAGWSQMGYDSGALNRNGEYYSKDPNHYNGQNETYLTINATDYIRIRLDEPTMKGEVTTHDATTAFDKVLQYAGASLDRDEVDTRYAEEARSGKATYKNGRIDLVSDVNGYTEANFPTGTRPEGFDTDNDGIPDDWERANGLNPNDASDRNFYTIDATKKRYTNLEVYLNSLVQDIMTDGNANAQDAVADYYPAYKKADGTSVSAINAETVPDVDTGGEAQTYTIAQSTHVSNQSATWMFEENNITVTNANAKGYSTGSEDGIKYSAGVQYTITLPEGMAVEKAEFKGYDNYADVDAYLKEVGGTEFGESDYVFPQKNSSGQYTVVTHTVNFAQPVSGKLTFTPAGKQIVAVITLHCVKGGSTGVSTITLTPAENQQRYNLAGQKVGPAYRGIVIRGGKRYMQR